MADHDCSTNWVSYLQTFCIWCVVQVLKATRWIWSLCIIISLQYSTSSRFCILTFSYSFSSMYLHLPTCMTVPSSPFLHHAQLTRAYLHSHCKHQRLEALASAFFFHKPVEHIWDRFNQCVDALQRQPGPYFSRSKQARWAIPYHWISADPTSRWTHKLLILWISDCDPSLIPWSAVTMQWKESVTMKVHCFKKWTIFPVLKLELNCN